MESLRKDPWSSPTWALQDSFPDSSRRAEIRKSASVRQGVGQSYIIPSHWSRSDRELIVARLSAPNGLNFPVARGRTMVYAY